MPTVVPTPAEVRAALEEILGWQGISRSPQLSDLLRYVVEKTLAGDGASIKAYSIAVDVFGRPQSFDPQSDPIVRVQARRLRALLEQFYSSGESSSSVQIRLPLGRYVPEFIPAPKVEVARKVAPETGGESAERGQEEGTPAPLRQFLASAFLGLSFTLIGVGLAIALVRFMLPQPSAPAAVTWPDYPSVAVGNFDNLTGSSALDDQIAQVGPRLARALGRFDALKVVPDNAGLAIRGAIQESNGRFSVHALLSDAARNGIVWSTTLDAPLSSDAADLFGAAVITLAAQLGNASGPLHASGRAWLKTQSSLPQGAPLYVCELEYMAWRDTRQDTAADDAAACFDAVNAREPDNATALAAAAGIRAWRIHYGSDADADLPALMEEETTAVARAVSLQPGDSFIYEQQGLVLARQGSLDAALGALGKAIELNPASMDAVAAAGLTTWLNGSFADGEALGEEALSTIPSPPPWYYMTRAFDALREKRYYDAIEAAQALAAGEAEYGPLVAVAAAPAIGRSDIVDRYRPQILGNPAFQRVGILPRASLMVKPQILIDRLREGLVLAGIPPAALDGPFTPDSLPRRN
ncbi:MAG TPA: hypothetical protein VHA07_03285 [Devosia sp.]|nr:hypothetical protein [Devosia sp.]